MHHLQGSKVSEETNDVLRSFLHKVKEQNQAEYLYKLNLINDLPLHEKLHHIENLIN